MRQYEPIWLRIKNKKTASIVTHVNNQTRVIKAVKKEKHRDTGYKLLLAEKGLTAKLVIVTEPKEDAVTVLIHFSLKTYIKTSCIGVTTL